MLLVLLAGMLYLLAQQFTGEDTAARQVEVPNVIGRPVDEAEDILREEGFEVEITEEANEDEPAGNVFDQDPKFGQRVDEGSTVQLKVSAGAPAIPVPDVIGAQVEQARQRLTADGFTVKEEQVVDEAAPVGEVVDQDPGPERRKRPAAPRSRSSCRTARPTRPVPDVVGKTIAEASNLLGQAGFAVNQTSEPSSTVEEGRVIRTEPPANSVQPKGAAITVVVSSGPAESIVPDVVGQSEANAINIISGDGLPGGRRGGGDRRPHPGRSRGRPEPRRATPPPSTART